MSVTSHFFGRLLAHMGALTTVLLLGACAVANDPGASSETFGKTVRAALQAQTLQPLPVSSTPQVTHIELEPAWGRHVQGLDRAPAPLVNQKAQ